MKYPYVVLCSYFPGKPLKAWRIGKDLTRITRREGLVPHFDPTHGPEPYASWTDVPLHAQVRRRTVQDGPGGEWHQDGDTTPGSRMDNAMVLWANTTHTEFKYNGTVFQPEPFQVVLIRNLGCFHRRPADAPRHRWTFRQRVVVPGHIALP